MGSYVQLGEVRTWYEEDGNGEPLVLLHPGGADSRAFEVNLPGLADRFRVFRPDRRGHGRTPDVDGPITYEQMAQDTIAFLEQVVGGPAYLVGHSDGAPVALLAALRRPDLVPRLVVASGVFHHDGWAPGAIDLDEETTAFFTAYHGAVSPDGPEHFKVLAAKLHRMQFQEPTLTVADLAGYPGPEPGHGRRRRRRDPHRAHPGPAPRTATVPAGGRARHRPRAVRRQARAVQPAHHRVPDRGHWER
jgi:pimeloyl-ACP methyl ester carboxylesterase